LLRSQTSPVKGLSCLPMLSDSAFISNCPVWPPLREFTKATTCGRWWWMPWYVSEKEFSWLTCWAVGNLGLGRLSMLPWALPLS